MKTRTGAERGSKAREDRPKTPEPPPRGEERDENGNPIDWDRPETLRRGSGLVVAVWLLVPLILIIIWGYFTR